MPDSVLGGSGTDDAPLHPNLRQQIDDIRSGRSTTLAFGRQLGLGEIAELPEEVRRLPGLCALELGDSDIKVLPSWLKELPNLARINLAESRAVKVQRSIIRSLPKVSWGLEAEQFLNWGNWVDPRQVSAVRISNESSSPAVRRVFDEGRVGALAIAELSVEAPLIGYPRSLKRMKSIWECFDFINSRIDEFLDGQRGLRVLSLFGFPAGRIPEPIRQLPSLDTLMLASIFPPEIPDWLFEIPELTWLHLGFNNLSGLSDALGSARGLEYLSLAYNRIGQIPAGVWELAALSTLDLTGCPIEQIPSDILRLDRLSRLDVSTSSPGVMPKELVVPPPEIAAQGVEAIKRYWSQERSAGIDYLAEAKLLIVGEPGAGKTSLAKKIIDPRYQLRTNQPSTEGIDVLAWQFPASIQVRDQVGEHLLKRDFRVNIWDFGGQEIYHSTHQFFLTRRSVYVLVTDERKEDTDFEYWLEIVNLLSDGSPLLIVQNRKQGRQHGVDIGALRQHYPNLVGPLVVDLADNSGLGAAVARIRLELEQLPHIGTALPKTWRAVRLALEADPRNYISVADFLAVCRAYGFTDSEDMRQLGGYLHDLGIFLFFQDDALLSKTVILNPEWGTAAVYRVLDDPQIADALGVFTRADLARIWSNATYQPMRDELLQLMVKFQLCFQVPGSDIYIAPQLLTPSQPSYHWDERYNLTLRYEYDVMPKGVVRRLIVALHYQIAGNLLWRTGAVFEYEGSRAEVIEVYRRRLLTIRIRGGDPRVLLGLIDHELGIIHRSYPGIRFKKSTPCDCETCAASGEPTMFEIGDLKDFAQTGDLIQCLRSRQMRDPAALLRMLSPDAMDRQRSAGRPGAAPREVLVQPEIYISYKWGGDSGALVDEVQRRMGDRGVLITRDKNEVRYRDSIQQFMDRIGAGKCVVIVLSKAYLESRNCMYELTRIAGRPEFGRSVYPVVMPDAGIFDPVTRVGYIKYWEAKRDELAAAMKEIGQEHLEGIRDDLDLYEDIRNTIARITSVLADMNTLTPDMHRDTDFEQLYTQLAAALQV